MHSKLILSLLFTPVVAISLSGAESALAGTTPGSASTNKSVSPHSGASVTQTVPEDSESKSVSALEQSALGRAFRDDPMDKRLRRLELFCTGGRQEGTVSERIGMIKDALSAKSRQSTGAAGSNLSKGHGNAAAIGRNLNQLEHHILKKTFPQLDENIRLTQLEKKVFGNTFPKLSSVERIDRLQKTIGIGEAETAELPPEMPGQLNGRMFGGSINPNGSDLQITPFGTHSGGVYGFSNDPDINRQLSETFRQINKQLQDMNRVAPGMMPPLHQFGSPFMTPELDGDVIPLPKPGHKSPQRISPSRVRPNQINPGLPGQSNSGIQDSLPPYLDQNSI